MHGVLSQHPEIAMPLVKEVDFFSSHYDHGYAWYQRQFPTGEGSVCGEISPSYFHDLAAPRRVAQYSTKMKILVSFRDPVQRALSNHRHEVRLGHLSGPDLSLENGLENNPTYINQGMYATHLRRWLEHFPREQMLFVLQEDIQENPAAVAAQLFRFLNVESTYRPQKLNKRFNRSFANRSAALSRAKDTMYRLTRNPTLSWLWNAGVGLGAKAVYRRLNVLESENVIPEPSAQTLEHLRQIFEPEIRDLSVLIGRSLDGWLP